MASPCRAGWPRPTRGSSWRVPSEQRAALYADRAWRDRARPQVAGGFAAKWPKATIEETERHRDLRGRTLTELAAERGVDAFDLMVDLSLEEELHTRFRIVLMNDDE